jgi:ADP-ribose pyrophosphatase
MAGDGTITLVRQYRATVGGSLLEIPAGTCDVDGESLEESARRELAEEVGLVAGQLRRLGAVRNSPGYSDQLTTIFLATDLSATATDRSGVEERFMSTVTVSFDEVADLVGAGTLVDATTVLGLCMARQVLDGSGRTPPT